MSPHKTVAYLRVSTDDQDIEKNKFDILQLANRLAGLSSLSEMQEAVDNWHLLTRDEQRKIVLMLIESAEIPHVTPHRELTARIIWFDDSSDEFTVRRTVRKDQVWTLAEIDTLKALAEGGATQLEIARALPTRKWENIRRQLRLHCGAGVRIPERGILPQVESFDTYAQRVGGLEANSGTT